MTPITPGSSRGGWITLVAAGPPPRGGWGGKAPPRPAPPVAMIPVAACELPPPRGGGGGKRGALPSAAGGGAAKGARGEEPESRPRIGAQRTDFMLSFATLAKLENRESLTAFSLR